MRALDAGPLDALKEKYGDIQEAAGFDYDSKIKPAIIMKKKSTTCYKWNSILNSFISVNLLAAKA